MRGLQLSLNQTQKLRLERALRKLESFSSRANSNASVSVADTIPVNYEDGVLKGHGTFEVDDSVVATVCGVVERVKKLIYVRILRVRKTFLKKMCKPETGDIIVGRVIEVAPKHWRLEINFSQDAVLMLSSMNLLDGIQRRRTAVDELNMCSIFEENDVICAEIWGFRHDGSIHLQARSQKYGKLERGRILNVPPYLVKRSKQHFHHLDKYRTDLILGCNGFIWVGEHVNTKDPTEQGQANKSEQEEVTAEFSRNSQSLEEQERAYMPPVKRQNICLMVNAVRVLSTFGISITLELLIEIVNLSTSLKINILEMLGPEFCVLVAEGEAEWRSMMTKKKLCKLIWPTS